jgi:hypothetical protein
MEKQKGRESRRFLKREYNYEMPMLQITLATCAELNAPGAIKETGRDTTPTLRILPVPVLCRHRTRLTHLL